jgi:hypothetical protein
MEIHEHYVTFGVQYDKPEKHPLGMTKDGYVVIEAPNMETAKRIAHAIFGEYFAFVYDKYRFIDGGMAAKWHHSGEMLRIAWEWMPPKTGGIVPPYITDRIKGHEDDQP